jgi:hypothetical protein
MRLGKSLEACAQHGAMDMQIEAEAIAPAKSRRRQAEINMGNSSRDAAVMRGLCVEPESNVQTSGQVSVPNNRPLQISNK